MSLGGLTSLGISGYSQVPYASFGGKNEYLSSIGTEKVTILGISGYSQIPYDEFIFKTQTPNAVDSNQVTICGISGYSQKSYGEFALKFVAQVVDVKGRVTLESVTPSITFEPVVFTDI